jgi:pilus assembly protein Flp/PilA
MPTLKSKLAAFAGCQSGATAIEYALIASGIAMAIVVIVDSLGGTLRASYTNVKTALN